MSFQIVFRNEKERGEAKIRVKTNGMCAKKVNRKRASKQSVSKSEVEFKMCVFAH